MRQGFQVCARDGPKRAFSRRVGGTVIPPALVLAFAVTASAAVRTSESAPAQVPDPTDAEVGAITLRRSDVVLSWGRFDESTVDACRSFGVTVWGWGPGAMYAPSYEALSGRIANARQLGMRLVMGTVCETIRPSPRAESYREFEASPELRTSECRDISGRSIAPSWWDIDYGNGDRSYWNCANNPAFQSFFMDKAARTIRAGADGLFIDGILSNRQVVDKGGCFCTYCMDGFRRYLEARLTPSELAARGVADVRSFEYGAALRKAFPAPGLYLAALKSGSVPFLEEFRRFQRQSDAAFINKVIARARQARDPTLPVAGNACMLLPDWLICGDFLDFFVIELAIHQEPGFMPILQHKLASALGKPIASWPTGPAVTAIKEQGLHGLVKMWIALCHALGGNPMIPHAMWASAHESGTMDLYDARVDETAPLYRMVREHARLFDGYDDVHQIAVLYSNQAKREGSQAVNQACLDLLDANISFELALVEDECVPRYATTSAERLSQRELVVIPEPTIADARLGPVYARAAAELLAQGKAVFWEKGTDLRSQVTPMVSLERGKGVWCLPRRKTDDARAPLVVHVVNHDYDRTTDTLRSKSDLVLRVKAGGLNDRRATAVTVIQPGRGPASLPIVQEPSGDLLATLPEGAVWWLVAIDLE